MTKTPNQPELTRLREVLDIYGADRSRWPAADRLSLGRFISDNEAARQLVGEYKALERLIDDAASREEITAMALSQRIFAAAERESRDRQAPAAATMLLPRAATRRPPVRSRFEMAAMAAAVALVFGIGMLAGLSGVVAPDSQEVASMDDTIDIDDPLLDEDVI